MQHNDDIKNKIESIFNSLHIKYQILDFPDNDLNYTLQVSTIGKLKALKSINCMLYLRRIDYSLNIMVANIYKIKESENILDIYELLNDLNLKISSGNFMIYGDSTKQIIYKASVNCGNNFSELDSHLVKFHLVYFISYLEELLDLLKNR
ncbi:hypothetical protein AMURIS_04955 [Acetatifactor muris]|uniref:Sensory transduction regulator n=2 Tax=Acetatifactor muris TaxID=879566 RepID=A0A2K4ZNY2_9FIRM|nr:hypothetical protein AMURIS_04955 [Acetatifactor muris]